MTNTPGPAFDPYQPPKAVEPKPGSAAPDAGEIRYTYAYKYIFENPNWTTNVLYGFLCILSSAVIPVIGQLLFMGYQWEVVEALHRYPGRTYPDFDFNKFSYYLLRSLWPFLVSLILSIPLVLIFALITGMGVGLSFALASIIDKDPVSSIVFGGGSVVSVMFSMVLLMLVSLPLQGIMLRAGLSQDFGLAFNFAWSMDFFKKIWKEMILFQLFMMVTAFPLALLGYACFCIGLYAAMAVLLLAQANMLSQLYNLYLARGGEPIPLKDPPPAVMQAGS